MITDTLNKALPMVIILLGPTCVGKTDVSLLLAEHLNTEIISADSMQIYRHMDIGTAKPGSNERKRIRHHMIDIIEPTETYSTGRYLEDVIPSVEDLIKRKKIPLIVGGTGLYIRAMTHGMFSAPDADRDLRDELLLREKESPGYLYECLKGIDPDASSRIMPADKRRIIRALEISIKAGESITKLQTRLTRPLNYCFIKIGLKREREELYRMIDERVDRMIEEGLIEEVKRFLKLNPSHTPMQAIGYKELSQYLIGGIGLKEAVCDIKTATKRFAKRQLTWFRREEGIRWIDITGVMDSQEIFNKINDIIIYEDSCTEQEGLS